MAPLVYHDGQRAIQAEAKTTHVADNLADWVGPVGEFAGIADLALLSTDRQGTLQFTLLSGPPPLVEVEPHSPNRIIFPSILAKHVPSGARCGGLLINLSQARRARVNGTVWQHADGPELLADETFTLCRKYMASSLPIASDLLIGPESREPLSLDNPWLAQLLAKAETSFLASISPQGHPDVAHRGGQPGFLKLDSLQRTLTWTEYLGDGVFKSAGNIRATGSLTLLIPDLDDGDAVEISGQGRYQNLRSERHQRMDPLVQDQEPYPVQGVMVCEIQNAAKLRRVLHLSPQASEGGESHLPFFRRRATAPIERVAGISTELPGWPAVRGRLWLPAVSGRQQSSAAPPERWNGSRGSRVQYLHQPRPIQVHHKHP